MIPTEFTLAQQLLLAMGVHPIKLMGHHIPKSKSNTKKGPGRRHLQGKSKKDVER